MSDLTIQVCDFHTPSKSCGKIIDKESVKKVLNSEKFKTNLKMGRCLGLFTHTSRYEPQNENVPYEDFVSTSPYLANCCRKLWIDESTDSLMGEFDLLDTEYGRLLRDMYKKNIMMSYSMSVSATADDKKYYIDDWFGCDSTWKPDLNAKVTKINFSENPSERFDEIKSGSSKFVRFSYVPDKVNFDDSTDNDVDGCPNCGNSIDECTCKKYQPSIRFESSEVTKVRPNVTKIGTNTENATMPVEPTDVGSISVKTNLDNNIAGNDIENINPENFNMLKEIGITNYSDLTITYEELHKDIDPENRLSLEEVNKLPNLMSSEIRKAVKNNFSIMSIKQEWDKPPFVVLKKRIDEVIQLCRASKQSYIDSHIDNLKAYFDSYMLTWVNNTVSGSSKDFNIALGLKLITYRVSPKNLMRLNRVIKRMKTELLKTGYTTKPIQIELNSAYQAIEDELYAYIDSKIKPKTFFPKTNDIDGGKKKK